MKKLILIAFSTVLLYGCPPCDPVVVDFGPLPESALALVPYVNGQTYRFRHSEGLVINYTALRETRPEIHASRTCDFEHRFEMNSTKLTPDYPVYTFMLEVSNPDSSHIDFDIWFRNSSFTIPSGSEFSHPLTYFDSVLIDDRYYYEVFRLRNQGYHFYTDTLATDSIYYNYEYGILQINMTNGERFTIFE